MPYITKKTITSEYFEPELYLEHRGVSLWKVYHQPSSVKLETGEVSLFKEPDEGGVFGNNVWAFCLDGQRSWGGPFTESHADGSINNKDELRNYDLRPYKKGGQEYAYYSVPAILFSPFSWVHARGHILYDFVNMPEMMKLAGLYPQNWREAYQENAELLEKTIFRNQIDLLLSNYPEADGFRRATGFNHLYGEDFIN
jgi:hypothetical protein